MMDELTRLCAEAMDLSPKAGDIVQGRVTPSIEDISIGSAKNYEAAVLFFDIRGFTSRISDDTLQSRLDALKTLNAVVPVVTHIVHAHDGYIEKNTGDGVMAVIGLETDSAMASVRSVNAALTIFKALNDVVNPLLVGAGLPTVHARIGIDEGPVLVSRLGTRTGRSENARNFMTVVGATANIACKIQNLAGTNEIWIGDQVKEGVLSKYPKAPFEEVTPTDWKWFYPNRSNFETYYVWKWVGDLMPVWSAPEF